MGMDFELVVITGWFADGGGRYGSGVWKGGGSFGAGKMGGGGLNDALLAYRKKQLADRKRLGKGRKKGPHDGDSGADELRRDLAHINGSHAVFKALKNGIHSALGHMNQLSAPVDPNAGKGSGSGGAGDAAKVGDGHEGDGHGGEGEGQQRHGGGYGSLFGGDNSNGDGGAGGGQGGTATGLSQYDEDALLKNSQKGKGEPIDPDADTIFKQISRTICTMQFEIA